MMFIVFLIVMALLMWWAFRPMSKRNDEKPFRSRWQGPPG